MKFSVPKQLVNLSAATFCSLTCHLLAEEFTTPPRYPNSRYLHHWNNSPFKKEAKPTPQQNTRTLPTKPHNLILLGVLTRGDEEVAYIQNRITKEVFRTSPQETDKQKPKLIKIDNLDKPYEYAATIRFNGEDIQLSYDRQQLNPSPESIISQKPAAETAPKTAPPENDIDTPDNPETETRRRRVLRYNPSSSNPRR